MPRIRSEEDVSDQGEQVLDKKDVAIKDNAPKFVHAKGWLRDKIIIHRQEGPGGIAPVFVELNNFACHIPREVECDVTKPIVQNLREAIATQTFRDEKNEEFHKDIQRYNFIVVEENINWEEIMSDERYAAMNEEYLKAIGKWNKKKAA